MTVLALREYESTEIALDAASARTLAAAAGNVLAVTVGTSPGTWRITAGGYVGTIVTPHVQVLLRPKVHLHNVFLLLDAGIPAEAWTAETFGLGSDPDLLPAVAAFFARAAARAVAKGARHDYVHRDERLVTLRGRIDLAAQLRTPGMVSPIACSYEDYEADIPENHALLAATRRLLHLPGVDPAVRRDLSRVALALADVSEAAITADEVARIPINRINQHYEPALRLAELILRTTSLQDRAGEVTSTSFVLSMPILFQRWVTARLRRHLTGQLVVTAEPTVPLDRARRIAMNPDLVFERHDSTVYVGDVKYKLSSGAGRSGDYYQLLAYTTSLHLDEGVLIYCQHDDAKPDHEALVQANGTRLWTYLLPMAGSNGDVEASVANLATWIAQRAASAATGVA